MTGVRHLPKPAYLVLFLVAVMMVVAVFVTGFTAG